MANQIRLKRASGSDPGASDLVLGEPAVRTDTGEIFLKKDDGSIAKVAGGIDDGDKGDITVSNGGDTFTIDNGVIDNANIASNAAIAGSKISPNFGSQNITTTGTLASGDLTLTDVSPSITFTDSNDNPDFSIFTNTGELKFKDDTNDTVRMKINADGHVDVTGNLDVGAGVDVTGNIAVSGTVDGRDVAADGTKLDGIESNATADQSASDIKTLFNSSGLVNAQIDASAAIAGTKISPDFGTQDVRTGGDFFIDVRGSSFKTADWEIFNTTSGNGLSISGGGSSSVKIAISSGGDVDVAGAITAPRISGSNGIIEMKQEIGTSQTLTTGYNAIAVDPTIANGITVTVPSGAVWAIV